MTTTNHSEPRVAQESQHWYDRDGRPVYEIPRAKGDGMRPATLADARKLGLVPGYSKIEKVAAKPGLEKWKLRNLLEASLTLPKIEGETVDEYAERVITDADSTSLKARERGTACHTAIEMSLRGETPAPEWEQHVLRVKATLSQLSIEWRGDSEKTFAHPLGYGGKCDLNWNTLHGSLHRGLLDFKTKERIDPKKLGYDENIMQLAAYAMGIFGHLHVRALNVFIGVEDMQVVPLEYTYEQLERQWRRFQHLLEIWYIDTGLERQ